MKKTLLLFAAALVAFSASATIEEAVLTEPVDATELIQYPTMVAPDMAALTAAWDTSDMKAKNASKGAKIMLAMVDGPAYGFTGAKALRAVDNLASKQAFLPYDIKQAIKVPCGNYTLKAKASKNEPTTNWGDNTSNIDKGALFLYANDQKVKFANPADTLHPSQGSVKILVADSDLVIRVYDEKNGNGRNGWYVIGDFELSYEGLPDVAPLATGLQAYVGQKMQASLAAELDTALAAVATTTAGPAICDLYNQLTSLTKSVPASVANYAAFAEAIAKCNALYLADQAMEGAADFKALIEEYEAKYAAAAADPTSDTKALVDAANEFDATYWIVNPNLADSAQGWKLNTNSNVTVTWKADTLGFTGPVMVATSAKKFKNFGVEQTITGLPNGDYYVSAKMFRDEGTNYDKGTVQVYANSTGEKTASFGKCAADTPVEQKVKVRVTNNTLTIGVKETDDRNNTLAFSGFRLTYVGFESWAKINGNVATASCVEEFVDALCDTLLNNVDAVIELKSATYAMGNAYKPWANFKSLTLKAADGQKPVLNGVLTPSQSVQLDYLTLDGLTFFPDSATSAEGATPLFFNKGRGNMDTIEVINYLNCTFKKFGQEWFYMTKNKGKIGKLNIVGNVIEDYGLVKVNGQHFIQPNDAGIQFGEIVFQENLVKNYNGKQFINLNVVPIIGSDSLMHITVTNNVFDHFGGGENNKSNNAENFIEFKNVADWKGAEILVANNIFNKNYIDTVTNIKVPVLINFTQSVQEYQKANSSVVVANNLFIGDSVMKVRTANPSYETVQLPTNLADFMEAYPNLVVRENAYTPADLGNYEYKEGVKMLQSSPLFTAGTNGSYLGLRSMYYDFQATETGARVNTAAAFKQALGYDYGMDDVIIEVEDCIETDGIFMMGDAAQTYGPFQNLTIKAAEGCAPKTNGCLTAQPTKLNSLTIDGLTFTYVASTTKEASSPLYIKGVSQIETLTVKNCVYDNLGKEMILGFRDSNGTARITTFNFTGNTIENQGLNQSDGGNHAFAINKGAMSTFNMTENVFNHYAAKQFLQFANLYPVIGSDSIVRINIEHNYFNHFGGAASSKSSNAENFMEISNNNPKGVELNIVNNIFNQNEIDTTTANKVQALLNFKTVDDAHFAATKINVLNNLFVHDSVMFVRTVNAAYEKGVNLPTNLNDYLDKLGALNRKELTLADFGMDALFGEGETNLLDSSPLYSAGLAGTYVGPACLYVEDQSGKKKVGYFVLDKTLDATATLATNDPIYNFLKADENLVVRQVVLSAEDVAKDTTEYQLPDSYDVIVITQGIGSGSKILNPGGALSIVDLKTPILETQIFGFRNDRNLPNCGNKTGAKNATSTKLKVNAENQGCKLFDGITFDENGEVAMFNRTATDAGIEGNNALAYCTVIDGSEGTCLGYPADQTAGKKYISVNYVKAGTEFGGATLNANMIILAQNFGALCADNGTNITEANKQLYKNAIYMLAKVEGYEEEPVDATVYDGMNTATISGVFAKNGVIYVNAAEPATISVVNMVGAVVKTVEVSEGLNAIEGLSAGQIYLVRGTGSVTKVIL